MQRKNEPTRTVRWTTRNANLCIISGHFIYHNEFSFIFQVQQQTFRAEKKKFWTSTKWVRVAWARGRERKKKWLEWKMHCTCSVACIHYRPSEWLWLWIHLTRAHTALAHLALKNWREIVEKHSSIVCSCTELCAEQFHGFMPCRMDGLRHLISIHPWQSQR